KSRLEKSNGYMSYTKEELQQLLLQLEETFGDLHATAIAFNLSHPVIASTVIGARTIEQLDENVKAYKKAQQISDLSIVQEIAKFDKYTDHR
ncbi:aldo/keto reductase, partial [Butyricicoccus sp. 1XD8-22]